jgi:hypothetical protein
MKRKASTVRLDFHFAFDRTSSNSIKKETINTPRLINVIIRICITYSCKENVKSIVIDNRAMRPVN